MLSGYQKYCGQNLTIYVKLNKLIIKHFLTVDLFVELTIYLWDLCITVVIQLVTQTFFTLCHKLCKKPRYHALSIMLLNLNTHGFRHYLDIMMSSGIIITEYFAVMSDPRCQNGCQDWVCWLILNLLRTLVV